MKLNPEKRKLLHVQHEGYVLHRLRGPAGQRLLAAFDTAEASPQFSHSTDLADGPAPAPPPQPVDFNLSSQPVPSAAESEGPKDCDEQISHRSMSTAEAGSYDEQHAPSRSRLVGTEVQKTCTVHHKSLEAVTGESIPQVQRSAAMVEAAVDKCGSGLTEREEPVSKQYDMAFAQEVRHT